MEKHLKIISPSFLTKSRVGPKKQSLGLDFETGECALLAPHMTFSKICRVFIH